jgi:disulfide bond formation protein DsbB
MRKHLLISLLLLNCCSSYSQQLTKAEYFFNTDPGVGLATSWSFSAADSISVTHSIPVPGNLPTGLNRLYIRVASNTGVWSQPEVFLVIVSSTTTQINKAEYFFDTDPGISNGTTITYPATDSINLISLINIPPVLSNGFHNLYIRTQNTTGTWGMPEIYPVIVGSQTTLINSGEYFWDTDPGFGNGTPFNFTAADSVISLQSLIAPNLPSGTHKLFTRIRSTDGGWSFPEYMDINICSEAITIPPSSQSVCAGSNVTFNVTATGTGLTYQWRKNGVNINGETSSSFTINNAAHADAGNYDVVVTGSCGSLTSVQATLTVNAATLITTHPQSQSVCSGGNISFNAAATGTGTLTYQWKKNGINISGATSSAYTINNVTPGDAANYTVEVTGNCGTVVSSIAVLSISASTSINTQPTSVSACLGSTVSFTVIASGSGVLSYQWMKNGINITGANSPTYTINNTNAADAATYTVEVTGDCGAVGSSPAILSINNSTTINSQPADQSVCPGATASFSVSAAGSGALTYQWKKNGVNISGASSPTYTISNATAGDAGNYTVDVTSLCGTTTSGTATLSLLNATQINTQPVSQSACTGGNVSFSVNASGSYLSYQWRKGGINIIGAINTTYTITGVTAADVNTYDVEVTGTCGNTISASVSLSLNDVLINTQPASQILCEGGNATFTVSASGGGILSYQWKKNGNTITGATSASYTINNTIPADAGNYTVDITNACGTVNSSVSVLTVNMAPAVSVQPQSQQVCAGGNVTFNINASGTGITYQWRKNGVNINGANSSLYNINNVSATDAANYDVVITGTCGTIISATAILSLLNSPAITLQPQSQSVFVGSNITFTTTASGNGLTYQWRKGGVNIPGATSNSYTINNVITSDAGSYDVVITGNCAPPATSAIAVLIVNSATITSQPNNQSACVGSNATFVITASGANLTYQWQVNNGSGFVNITGANSSSLTLSAVTHSQNNYQYRCVVSGSLNSAIATLTVNPLPVVILNLPFDTLNLNSPVQILSGGQPVGGVFSGPGISNGTFLPGAFSLGSYTTTYRYTDINGCSASATDLFTIVPTADKINIFPVPVKDGKINIAVSPDLVGGKIIIFSSNGQKMGEWFISGRHAGYLLKWPAGFYTAIFMNGNIKISKQFLITR